LNRRDLWPIVIPLPIDLKVRRKLLLSLFSSPITMEVLKNIPLDREILQRDLINLLSRHSNRTVIKSLKILKELGFIHERDVVLKSGLRRVRMKSYSLTDVGKWFYLMFKDPREIRSDALKKIVEEFIKHIINRITGFYNVNEALELSEMLLEKISKSYINYNRLHPEVFVLGSVAVDHYFRLSENQYLLEYEYLGTFPGGSGANVACVLSRHGSCVGFFGKIASDTYGIEVLLDLIRSNIDLRNVVIDKSSRTLETLVLLNKNEESKIICMLHKKSALSPTTIDDETLNRIINSKAIYVGEVFHEVSSKVLEYVKKNNDIIVIYRPSMYALKYMTAEYLSLLKYSPILVLNNEKVNVLMSKGIDIPSMLFNLGAKYIIITMGAEGATLFIKDKHRGVKYRAPRVKPLDTTGAGDVFSATLLYMMLKGVKLNEAIRYAIAAASISTQYIGARERIPTIKEVEEKLEEVKVET